MTTETIREEIKSSLLMSLLKIIVALHTASAAAFALQVVLDVAPVTRMGVDLEPQLFTGRVFPDAVALQADIAVGMTGLTGAQITPRLDGVIARPDVMTDQHPIGMAIPAVGRRKIGMVGSYAGERNIPKLPPVGLEL